MARPVRPGTGTTHRTSEASQPGKQNGTLFADPIRASSPKSTASTGRTEDCSRPTPIRQISLAMREPSTEDVRSSGGSCSDADAVTHGRASSCVGCVKRHSQAAGRRAWDACSNMALALRLQRRWEGREVLSLPSWPFSRLVAAAGQPGQDGGTSLDCPATPASTQIGKMPVTPQRSVAGPARRSLHAVSAATSADPAAAAPSHRQSR